MLKEGVGKRGILMNIQSQRKIYIYRSARLLSLYEENTLMAHYPIAVGKASTPTPLGHYAISEKIMYPGGAYGSRWLGLSLPEYGIHGTNNLPVLVPRLLWGVSECIIKI